MMLMLQIQVTTQSSDWLLERLRSRSAAVASQCCRLRLTLLTGLYTYTTSDIQAKMSRLGTESLSS